MSKDDSLRDLIERVERATEGSRELDAIIGRAVGRVPMHAGFAAADDVAWDKGLGYSVPRYTASLDAARKLIPAGAPWSVNDYAAPKVAARVYGYHEGFGATPALALVAASLRAHMGTGG